MTRALLDVLAVQPEYGPTLRRLVCELAIAGRLLPRMGDWAEHRLDEVVSVRGGSTPSMARPEFWGGVIPWVSPKDMHAGEIVTSEMFITPEALAKTNLELVPLNSVLIVGRSGILKRKLPAQVTRVPCTVNQDIKALTPSAAIDSAYLRLWLLGSEREILAEDVKTGTTVQSLVFSRLFARRVLLPPTPEQHRIVAKVDELMALCDRLEARQQDAEAAHARLVQALLDSLTQARDADEFQACWRRVEGQFHSAFTSESAVDLLVESVLQLAVEAKLSKSDISDEPASELLARADKASSIGESEGLELAPFVLPAKWCLCRLGDFAQVKGGKRLPAGKAFASGVTPFVYLQVTNMKRGTITNDNLKYIDRETRDAISKYTISSRDLYITIAGTIGEVGSVPEQFSGMNLTENAAKIVFDGVDRDWLRLALCSRFAKAQFYDKQVQMAQPKLALHRVASALIALPPLLEQRRIVAKVTELLALCDQLKARIVAARAKHAQLAEALVAQAVAD